MFRYICVTFLVVSVCTVLYAVEESPHVHGEHFEESFQHRKDGETDDYVKEEIREAFLGEQLAEDFDDLDGDTIQFKLSKLFLEVDADNDGFIGKDELVDHVVKTFTDDMKQHLHEEFIHQDANKDGKVTMEEYSKHVFGGDVDDDAAEALEQHAERFKMADADNDGGLTPTEFLAFDRPEEVESLHSKLMAEYMEGIDLNKDAKISWDEYAADMGLGSPEDMLDDPNYYDEEKKKFSDYYDKDSDGFLDVHEAVHWMAAPIAVQADEAVDHILTELDRSPRDQRLSKDELVSRWEFFKLSDDSVGDATLHGDGEL